MSMLTTTRAVRGQCEEAVPRDGTVSRESGGYTSPGQSVRNVNGAVTLGSGTTTVPLCAAPQTSPNAKMLMVTDIYLSTNDTTAVEFKLQAVVGATAVTIMDFSVIGSTGQVQLSGMEQPCNVPPGAGLQLVVGADLAKIAYFVLGIVQQDVGVG